MTVTSSDLRQLYVDLKNVEGNLRVELRKGVANAATPVVQAVRSGASWSGRIPGAVKAKPSFSAKQAGVSIVVDSKKAPEARPLEHNGQGGNFRHPVYARPDRTRSQWTWVNQPARPFFWHGVQAADSQVDAAMVAVLDAVARKARFK